MTEEYIRWLAQVYSAQTGEPQADPELIAQAKAALRWHGRRQPSEEDFISLVAMKMLDALGRLDAKPTPSFLKMFSRAADAARHQIARAARKERASETGSLVELTSDKTESEATTAAVLAEAIADLTLEEQTVLSLILQGESPAEVSQKTGVSLRTIYRRVQAIRRRLSNRN